MNFNLKKDARPGSAAFVVAPIGCFLGKLLWPVCARQFHQLKSRICVYVGIAQPLPNWALFCFCLLHHLSSVPHITRTAQSINTVRQLQPICCHWESGKLCCFFNLRAFVYFGDTSPHDTCDTKDDMIVGLLATQESQTSL